MKIMHLNHHQLWKMTPSTATPHTEEALEQKTRTPA